MTTTNFENNYTTPEQIGRVLNLGVPANSADCYHELGFDRIFYPRRTHGELQNDFFNYVLNGKQQHIPIWSAGQLLKICFICGGEKFIKDSTYMLRSFTGTSLSRRIDEMTETIVRFMEDRDDIFDFTKLNN